LKDLRRILWPDTPAQSDEAIRQQLDDYLARALAAAPKRGKGARRRRFLRHVIAVAKRYASGLYHSYDDSRIPQTTNDLEGSHGVHKHHIRKVTGRRSTSGGPTETAGEFVTCALDVMKPDRRVRIASVDPVAYAAARRELARIREPARRYRSVQRDPEKHVAAALARWETR
jgi:hypothetical protein